MKLVGFRKFEYTSKRTGQIYPACNLYVTYPPKENSDTVGLVCESIFCPVSSLGTYQPKVGDEIKVYYNRYGSVDAIDYAK